MDAYFIDVYVIDVYDVHFLLIKGSKLWSDNMKENSGEVQFNFGGRNYISPDFVPCWCQRITKSIPISDVNLLGC